MPILIRDEHFEKKIEAERTRRKQSANAKTVTQLAEERLVEIQTGQFIPPVEMSDAEPVSSQ